MFAKVWGLRINFIFLPRSAKKKNFFLRTVPVRFFSIEALKKNTISLKKGNPFLMTSVNLGLLYFSFGLNFFFVFLSIHYFYSL